MTQQTLEQIYNAYLGAYGITNAADRDRLLSQCVAREITSVLPNEENRGIAQLSLHIERFQNSRPRTHFRSKVLSVHHEQFLASLVLCSEDEQVLANAHVYGRFNGRGLLTYLIGFFF